MDYYAYCTYYIYVYIYIYTFIYIHNYTHLYIYIYTYTIIHIYIYIHTFILHIYIFILLCILCVYIYVYIYIMKSNYNPCNWYIASAAQGNRSKWWCFHSSREELQLFIDHLSSFILIDTQKNNEWKYIGIYSVNV